MSILFQQNIEKEYVKTVRIAPFHGGMPTF